MWFDKHNPLATFVDIRPEVEPDIVADATALGDAVVAGYDLVVFDPPHVNTGQHDADTNKGASFKAYYGRFTTDEIRALIVGASREAHRVTREDALMAFKWNDHDQKLDRVLALMSQWWEPLFGQRVATRTKHASGTYWVMLRRLAPSDTSQARED